MSTASEKPTIQVQPITVNGELITETAIAQEVQHHPSKDVESAIHEAANALVIQCLLKQKANALGLVKEGVSEEDAISQLLAQEAVAPEANDEECQRYFQSNREKFCTSPLVEVSHILLAVSPDDVAGRMDVKEQAEALLEKVIENPASFTDLARQYSACPSKETGGSLGQISKGQTVAEFERVVFNAETGIVPHPIESRYGFHIALINRKVEGNPLEYGMVSDQIRQYLNEKTQRKVISQYLQILMGEAEIDGFTPLVSGSPLMQ